MFWTPSHRETGAMLDIDHSNPQRAQMLSTDYDNVVSLCLRPANMGRNTCVRAGIAPQLAVLDQCRLSASSSSRVRGQSFPSSLDSARSASTLPPVWHLAQ